MAQAEQILEFLKKGNPITPIDALNLFGCFRLGARIFDLRREGYNIVTEIVEDGEKHYARYRLVED
ncbi:helix-turn-helix domain-containing protein [Basilea psittacipulmonis]|uniref:Winged helix-turn-helix domain-containing protein n=1 Tax=Basilea psittacipulmonis DSM 24701 TaxID=1072685 RepID=A0A077DIZ7_9BURK|nr:helix-turn-helix domain-containing protein [Basilea psittacipulmonis]AIL33108.1 hypothetical protein IX83_07155 [Basilea psittacipulmonis DSM 24701]